MKITPQIKTDPLKKLTPLQRTTRVAAIVVAFLGVFVWFFKILFF